MLFSNNWRDEECEKRRLTAGKSDFDCDLADRVYTSQLIGKVPDLVMHGGGNTSCKTKAKDLFDEEICFMYQRIRVGSWHNPSCWIACREAGTTGETPQLGKTLRRGYGQRTTCKFNCLIIAEPIR